MEINTDNQIFKPVETIDEVIKLLEGDHFLQIYTAQSTILNILGWLYKSYHGSYIEVIDGLYDRAFYEKSYNILQNFHTKLDLENHPTQCSIRPLAAEKIEAHLKILSFITLSNLLLTLDLIEEGNSLSDIEYTLDTDRMKTQYPDTKITIVYRGKNLFTYTLGKPIDIKNKKSLETLAEKLFTSESILNEKISNLMNAIPELILSYFNEFYQILVQLQLDPDFAFKYSISGITLEVYTKVANILFGELIKSPSDERTAIKIIPSIISALDPSINYVMIQSH